MLVVSKHTRNFTVLFLTSLGIVAFLLFYIFGFIPDNERRINSRNYRVLHRMGENMSISVVNYATKVGSSYVSAVVKRTILPLTKFPFKDTIASNLFSKYLNDCSLDKNELVPILKKIDKTDKLIGKFGIRFKFLDDELSDSSKHFENGELIHYSEEAGITNVDFRSQINETTIKELEVASIKLKDRPEQYKVDIKVPVDSMLSPLMRWDTFTHLIVLRRDEPTKQEASNKQADSGKPKVLEKINPVVPSYKILYNSGQNADLIPVDTLGYLAHKSPGRSPANVMIAGVPYKMYTLTQQIGSGEKWYLFGTIPTEKYEMESRAIPADIVSFAALAFVILLLAFPFLKLVLMSQQERLYTKDIILSFLSLFVGLSLVILLLFNVYAFYGIDRNVEKVRLKTLSSTLILNFRQEIALLQEQARIFNNCPDSEECTISTSNYWEKVSGNEIKRQKEYYFPNVQRVFWADTNGRMTTSWIAEKNKYYNNAKVFVDSREYFKIINSGGGWSLDKDTTKFALESITSFTDGIKYAVLSMRSHRANSNNKFSIVALATKLTSLYKPILPPGYGFCVIDKTGKVLFHQNEDLNLNENLLEETNFDPHLKAALYGQAPAHFVHNYQGNHQQLFIAPIKDLPYFMVTYINEDYHKGFNVNLLVLTAMFLSLYLFSLAIVSVLIIWFNKGYSGIVFHWLWLKKNNGQLYFKVILALLGTSILTLWQININYQLSSFFIFLFAATYILVFIYSILNQVRLWLIVKRSLLIILSLNLICFGIDETVFGRVVGFQVSVLILLFILERLWQDQSLIKYFDRIKIIRYVFPRQKRTLRLYVIMIGGWLILTSALPALTLFRVAYNYEADLMVRFNQMYLARALSNIKESNSVSKLKSDISNLVTNSRFSYTNFFYHTVGATNEAYSSELNSIRYAKDFKIKEAEATRKSDTYLSGLLHLQASYRPTTLKDQKETMLLSSIISNIRPVLRNVLSDEYYLKSNNISSWNYKDNHNLQLNYSSVGDTIQLYSHLPKFELPSFRYTNKSSVNETQESSLSLGINKSALLFWADIVLLLALLYLLLSFVVNRIFNMDLIADVQKNHADLSLFNPTIKNNLFLISLPQAQSIKEIIRWVGKEYKVVFAELNLANITKVDYDLRAQQELKDPRELSEVIGNLKFYFKNLWLRQKLQIPHLIIKNFDHDPCSKESLKFKISLLREVNRLSDTKVILQSSLHPSWWEEKLHEAELKAGKNAEINVIAGLFQELLAELNAYTKVYQSLRCYAPKHQIDELAVNKANQTANLPPETLLQKKMQLFITKECKASDYLQEHYAPVLKKYVQNAQVFQSKEENDKGSGQELKNKRFPLKEGYIILRLQSLAQLYYQNLWDLCSEEEQYFLYDLAQDGLVNSKNEQVLSSLLGKGLLVTGADGLIKVMNESFSCFIRIAVNPSEALRYEKSKSQGSSWEVYKTPLVIVLVGAVLFFFFTQKSSWANIIAILTAMSTFLSILPRLSFLVPSFLAAKEVKSNE